MGKRSKFVRLGEHHNKGRSHANRIREMARDDLQAARELRQMRESLTPAALDAKKKDIVERHFGAAAEVYQRHGLPEFERGVGWKDLGEQRFGADSEPGMASAILRLLETALELDDPRSHFAFIVGYGIAQKHMLMVREFRDGPALAREAAASDARSEGGSRVADRNKARDGAIRREFEAARTSNSCLTPSGWAAKNCSRLGLSSDRVRKILGQAQST